MSNRLPQEAPQLAHLLQLVGAAEAPGLLRQLLADLGAASAGLTEATSAGDLAGLRRHSHVLIALAGTIGAEPLRARASALNLSAQGEGEAATTELAHSVISGTAALIRSLRDEGKAGGMTL